MSATVSGSVLAYPPDGGTEVRVTNNVRLDGPSDFTFTGQTTNVVTDSNITNTYVPIGMGATGPKLEVTGPLGAPVSTTATISGTLPGFAAVPTVALQNGTQVALTSASLATLTAATGKGNCTYVESSPTLALGATATAMPVSPMASRTAVTVTNHTSNRTLTCVPGGTASATLGKVIPISGGWWKWEGAQAGWTLTCICLNNGTPATGCLIQIEEERCYQ